MLRPDRFQFTADFWGNEVLLNQKIKAPTNGILTDYLLTSFDENDTIALAAQAENAFLDLFPSTENLREIEEYNPEEEFSNEFIVSFDRKIRTFARSIEEIDQFELSKPPYQQIYGEEDPVYCDRVFQILHRYNLLWRLPEYLSDDIKRNARHMKYTPFVAMQPRRYPDSFFVNKDSEGYMIRYGTYSVPVEDFRRLVVELYEVLRERKNFLFHFMDWVDMMRLLLDKYIHVKAHFLTDIERARAIEQYEKDYPDLAMSKFFASNMQVRTRVIEQDGKPAFTESYVFQDAHSFFFVDFMRGLKSNYLPKRCSNCGRWFLLQGGKYLEYCSRPLENDPDKTCRDIGAQESYAQKCKTDPVWQTYLRAYKTHFARRSKGRMTSEQFRLWGEQAIQWREQAERGEMEFEVYRELIRK